MIYNPSQRKLFYEKELLREMPRLLSRLNRSPVSASSGCLDREFWAWATKDFANADLQRGLLVLAYLYKTPFEGNRYFQHKTLLKWLASGIAFWIKSQNKKGAFDHLYVYESSWMAAAFTLVDLMGIFQLVGSEMPADLQSGWRTAMQKTGWYLVRNHEQHGFISNHRAGAAAGLLRLARLTGEPVFYTRAWELLNEIYAHQSREGWFLEYEGADPGYQTLDTHYQAICYLESGKNPRILGAVLPSLDFLSHFIHPDGSIGGEYGSRNCPHFFPGGIEVFAESSSLANAMASLGIEGLATGNSCGLSDSDDRNAVPMATSYILAHQALCNWSYTGDLTPPVELPCQRSGEWNWQEAGIYIRSDPRFYIVFGASKGGVIKIFDKKRKTLAYSSCGYSARLGKHEITTLLWTSFPSLNIQREDPKNNETDLAPISVSVQTPFYSFRSNRLMSPLRFFLFRLFNISAGRLQLLNDFVRRYIIIGLFLKQRKPAPVLLKRTMVIGSTGIKIEDDIQCSSRSSMNQLIEHGYFSTVYMASAGYFRLQDLAHAWSTENLIKLCKNGCLKRSKDVLFDEE